MARRKRNDDIQQDSPRIPLLPEARPPDPHIAALQNRYRDALAGDVNYNALASGLGAPAGRQYHGHTVKNEKFGTLNLSKSKNPRGRPRKVRKSK